MFIPFGEYKPDISDYRAQTTRTLANVLPRADGYGPMPSTSDMTGALAEGNDTFTKVLLHFNGADASTTITDSNSGGSAHTWTAAGNAQIDTADSKFGGASLLLDGTGDWVTTNDSADFTVGAGDFTVDFWFKINIASAVDGTNLHLCGQCDNASVVATTSFRAQRNGATNGIIARACVGGTPFQVNGTTQFTNSVNTGWHHFAFVRTGNTLKMFLDGVQDGGDVSISGAVNDSSNALRVGAAGENTNTPWNGWIDEWRLSVGVAHWTANFTPPTREYDTAANCACRGLFFARKTDGTVAIFAATATKLLLLNNTAQTWTDVSKNFAAYSSVPSGEFWQFAQFNQLVIAVQANVAPQVYDLASPATFTDLGGSPPQARYIAIVSRFIVLSGLLSNPFRVQWTNSSTTWTTGSINSDSQDFTDGGIVRGVGGGETGLVMQDGGIRRMIFLTSGTVTAFRFERLSRDVGIFAPYSLAVANDSTVWLAPQGFHQIKGNSAPIPIGRERVDRTVMDDYDSSSGLMIAAADPKSSRIFIAYKSNSLSSVANQFDKIVGYDTALDRFIPPLAFSGEFLARIAQPGLTLENLDAISPSLDALTQSLDSFAVAQTPELAMVTTSHKVALFRGANLEATLVTAEQDAPDGTPFFVRALKPSTDAVATDIFASVLSRATQQSSTVQSTESQPNVRGECPQRVRPYLARGKLRIQSGATWKYASGIEADVV